MVTLIAKNTKHGFAQPNDLACGEPVAVTRHGRNDRIMDQDMDPEKQ